MKLNFSQHQKVTWLEVLGFSVCGIGLCFALGVIGVSYSQEQLTKEKQQVVTKMDQMRNALVAAKIPEEQLPGLLRVHKEAVLRQVTHEHFIVLSFIVLLSLLVSSLGFSIMLWAKLRTILLPNKGAAPNGGPSEQSGNSGAGGGPPSVS